MDKVPETILSIFPLTSISLLLTFCHCINFTRHLTVFFCLTSISF